MEGRPGSHKLMNDEDTQLALRHWINKCGNYRDRGAYQKWRPKPGELPSREQIEREKLDSDYESADDPDALRMGFGREDDGAKEAPRKRARKAKQGAPRPAPKAKKTKASAKASSTSRSSSTSSVSSLSTHSSSLHTPMESSGSD